VRETGVYSIDMANLVVRGLFKDEKAAGVQSIITRARRSKFGLLGMVMEKKYIFTVNQISASIVMKVYIG